MCRKSSVSDDPGFVARVRCTAVLACLLRSPERMARWEKTGKVGEKEVGLLGIKERRAFRIHQLHQKTALRV